MPTWLLSGTSGLFGLLGSEGTCPTREIVVTGQASRPVAGSIVPARLFTSGWLNMSYVICPVASPVPPASSNSVMLKPPRPGSLGDNTSIPPPPSCSPFNGKSSWNTKIESFDGGKGVGCASIVRELAVVVGKEHVVAGGVIVHTTGAPPMPWPAPPPSNGLAASPGSTVR